MARVGGCSQEAAEQQSAGLEANGTDMMTTKPFYRFSKGMTQDEVLPQFAVVFLKLRSEASVLRTH